jgi:hypothetical protein
MWPWAIWILGTFFAARTWGWQGVLVAHFVVAIMVVVSDVAWIQAEIDQPEWSGSPDQDMLFHWGCLFRVVVVNSLLLPVALVGIFCGHGGLKRWESLTEAGS